jgi:3-deoxy-manno-octulosonate cytidylyltransferase (CMP-KDO synthetase)
MARTIAVIPARLGSKRFSQKVLYPIDGRPLIYYVWRGVRRSRLIDRIYIATDSVDVGRAVTAFGGTVIMTSRRPRNGSERVAEAIAGLKCDLVINIQADNLGLSGTVLDTVIADMRQNRSTRFATLARKIGGAGWQSKLNDPNVVKVVEDGNGHAAWFSRLPIPYIRDAGRQRPVDLFPYLEHIGVYFYGKPALLEYASWRPGRVERAESLEQLRILENGEKIRLYKTRAGIISVDRKEALKNVKGL